jgi:hypothetical protein
MSRTNIFVYFINLTVIIVFLLGLHTSEPVRFVIPCSASDTRSILSQAKDIGSYEDTKKEFEKSFGPNTKMFSYPGDTIFYVLFNQQMPYYPTIYEASSAEAQNVLVRYIVKNKIDHIIYNYKNTSIQEEVPNYIRATSLHRYILNNFSITKRKDNYLFLQRTSKQEDFFKSNNFSGITDFRNYLLTVNMESIPRTEGIYKSNYLYSDNSKLVKVSSSIGEVNEFLHSNNINSQHTFITLEFSEGSKKEKSTIKIKTKDNLTTSVTFNQCDNKPCIIHLDNIPLFSRNRIIEHIQTESGDPIKNINIFTISNNIYFW